MRRFCVSTILCVTTQIDFGYSFTHLWQKQEGLWGKLTAVGEKQEIIARRHGSLIAAMQSSQKVTRFFKNVHI